MGYMDRVFKIVMPSYQIYIYMYNLTYDFINVGLGFSRVRAYIAN